MWLKRAAGLFLQKLERTMLNERTVLRKIFDAALSAVAPGNALLRHLRLENGWLCADTQCWQLQGRTVRVLGAGKGVAPMARAVEVLLGEHLREGLVVVKYGHGLPLKRIRQMEAGHPVPDANGVAATAELLRLAGSCKTDDLLLCLFTGGASALTPAPAEDLTLDDLQETTRLLLGCGATIQQLNAVRKHLSAFGGGQLARAANGAELCSIIISDVVGDPLDVIASGPTAPDPATFADCQQIVRQFGLEERLPTAVRQHLAKGLAGQLAETPKPGDALFDRVLNILAATNRQALDAAARAAKAAGYEPIVLTDRMTGEARLKAVELVEAARRYQAEDRSRKLCLLAGGETTVTIKGNGLGGRNQEMALAAALALDGGRGICGLFAGTDGTDGPTDAAGGFAFSDSVARMGGHDTANEFLNRNDSNTALIRSGDILKTGPTRTNVMDIAILLVMDADGSK